MCAVVLSMELAGPKTKAMVGINMQTPFALAEALVALMGFWIKDWRDYQVYHIRETKNFKDMYVLDLRFGLLLRG